MNKASGPRDSGLIPGLGRFPGRGNGNSLQYSCLENCMDRGTWWATVHGITKSQTLLSTHTHTHRDIWWAGRGDTFLVMCGKHFLKQFSLKLLPRFPFSFS